MLSPADLADGIMRGIIDRARPPTRPPSGVNGDRFTGMVELIGEPPGILDELALFMRGDLPLDQMLEIIAYSRVNTKYSDLMLMIMSSYMSPADVIELAIKGVVDVGDRQGHVSQGRRLRRALTTLAWRFHRLQAVL